MKMLKGVDIKRKGIFLAKENYFLGRDISLIFLNSFIKMGLSQNKVHESISMSEL